MVKDNDTLRYKALIGLTKALGLLCQAAFEKERIYMQKSLL